jgi:hypothetical protein
MNIAAGRRIAPDEAVRGMTEKLFPDKPQDHRIDCLERTAEVAEDVVLVNRQALFRRQAIGAKELCDD